MNDGMNEADLLRLDLFLADYDALIRKHNLQVGSCGCCESPWVSEFDGRTPEQIIKHLREEGIQ